MGRFATRIYVVAFAIFLPFFPTLANSTNSHDQLLEQIDSLRCEGRYNDALVVAREVLHVIRKTEEAQSYEIGDAERLVTTLEHAAKLPREKQKELANADQLTALYDSLFDEGEFDKALEIIDRQLRIKRAFFSEQHQEIATCLNIKGFFIDVLGDYKSAEPLYRKALEIRRSTLEPVHPEISESLTNYAYIRYAQDYYREAERYYREALTMDRALFGDEDPSVATDLDNLASCLHRQGDFVSAEPLYRQALAIRRAYYNDMPLDVATSLNNLGTLLHDKWDLSGAEPCFREALNIYNALGVEVDPDLARTTNNLASLLQDMETYADAKRQYHKALEIERALYGEIHPDIATTLNNLAALYHDIIDYAAADSLYREALEMNRNLYGDKHRHIATSQFNLARNFRDRGDFKSAEPLYRKSLEMYQSLLSSTHPNIVKNLYSYTTLLAIEKKYDSAAPLLRQATELYEGARSRVGRGVSRATFVKSPYPKLAIALLNTNNYEDAWPAVERDLGRILSEFLVATNLRSLDSLETATEDSLQQVLRASEDEHEAFLGAASDSQSNNERRRLEDARKRILEAEAAWSEFQRKMTEKYPLTEGVSYSLEHVQRVLPEESALLGWLDVEEKKGEYSSWGYVLRRSEPVYWVRLDEGESQDELSIFDRCRLFRDALAKPSRAVMGIKHSAKRIYQLRIAPLSEALKGITNLIVIPSGPMLGIPVETLIDQEGSYLGDRYRISYTLSATIYARHLEESKQRPGVHLTRALLIGDPPFSPTHVEMMQKEEFSGKGTATDPEIHPNSSSLRGIATAHRNVLSSLPRLSGSRDEIGAIASLIDESTVLLGQDASEMRVVDLLNSGALRDFSLIHIASHALLDNQRPEQSVLVLSQVDLPDPLQSAMHGKRVYDGLVSAKEVAREWHINADLVALSACETALGKEVSGEGYIGLSHSFFRAGARSLLVSLWLANDRATSMLMKRFYENYFGQYTDERSGKREKPMSKAAALQEAKRWLRTFMDENNEAIYKHPFYWSSFVLIGEPN